MEKVKLLKVSNFTFFHIVFYAICILKPFNSHISVGICSFFKFGTVSKWCIREWVKSPKQELSGEEIFSQIEQKVKSLHTTSGSVAFTCPKVSRKVISSLILNTRLPCKNAGAVGLRFTNIVTKTSP